MCYVGFCGCLGRIVFWVLTKISGRLGGPTDQKTTRRKRTEKPTQKFDRGGRLESHIKCVFRLFLQLLSETFLIVRRIQLDIIINMCRFNAKYSLFLSDFNEIWIFPTDFWKTLKYQISWKSVQWAPSSFMQTDGRADMRKARVAFCNFAKAPKKNLVNPHYIDVTVYFDFL